MSACSLIFRHEDNLKSNRSQSSGYKEEVCMLICSKTNVCFQTFCFLEGIQKNYSINSVISQIIRIPNNQIKFKQMKQNEIIHLYDQNENNTNKKS